MSVRVQDVKVISVAVAKSKQDTPWPIYVDRPEISLIPLQLMQSHTVQPIQGLKIGRRVDLPKPTMGKRHIHAGKPGLALFDELPRSGALDRADHAYPLPLPTMPAGS